MVDYDLIIIGSGPGGYVAAIRAAQLGMKVACVEKEPTLGGTCLNIGCIPSKSLLNLSEYFHRAKNFTKIGIEVGDVKLNLPKMMQNKDKAVTNLTKGIEFLFKKNKVTYFKGTGRFKSVNQISILDKNNKETIIETEKTIISTGSEPMELPGIKFDEKRILSSTGALSLSLLPKKMVVIGAGYIGLELGSVWSRLGTEVHVVEFLDHITPGMDKEISKEFMKILIKQGLNFHLQTKVDSIKKDKKGVMIKATDKTGKKIVFESDVVLISVGRKPYTKNLNLEKINIELDNKNKIKVNKNFETNIPNIYAIGDAISGPALAHKASEEAIALSENLKGQSGNVNYDCLPSIVYTKPEIGSVGKTEQQIKKLNTKFKSSKFPLIANSRAKINHETEGFVKIIADAHSDKILGVHIVASNAGEMIAEAAIAMEFSASSEDLARTIFGHPSMSESIKESAMAIDKRAIHF